MMGFLNFRSSVQNSSLLFRVLCNRQVYTFSAALIIAIGISARTSDLNAVNAELSGGDDSAKSNLMRLVHSPNDRSEFRVQPSGCWRSNPAS